MLGYVDFIKYFGSFLVKEQFKSFLAETFVDLTEYNIFEGYMISELAGIELGFTNEDAIYDDDEEIIFEPGNPVFSHCNFYPKSEVSLPFDISFNDTRKTVFAKAGLPVKTNSGYSSILNYDFLVDSYKIDDIILTISYNSVDETINSVQFRDNDIIHSLKL